MASLTAQLEAANAASRPAGDAAEDGGGIIHVASATCGSCGHTRHVELRGCSHGMALYHDKTIALVKQFL